MTLKNGKSQKSLKICESQSSTSTIFQALLAFENARSVLIQAVMSSHTQMNVTQPS